MNVAKLLFCEIFSDKNGVNVFDKKHLHQRFIDSIFYTDDVEYIRIVFISDSQFLRTELKNKDSFQLTPAKIYNNLKERKKMNFTPHSIMIRFTHSPESRKENYFFLIMTGLKTSFSLFDGSIFGNDDTVVEQFKDKIRRDLHELSK